MTLNAEDWAQLLDTIAKKECLPFIGAGTATPWIPLGKELATDLAREYEIPTYQEDSFQLSRVAQMIAVNEGTELRPKDSC
jgi:hypothetical protein